MPQPMAYLSLPLTARAYSVADRLQRLEKQLNPAQLQMIEGSIARLESLLGVGQNHTPAYPPRPSFPPHRYDLTQYSCLSNGEMGGFEKFSIYSRNSKSTMGGYTTLNDCQSIQEKTLSY